MCVIATHTGREIISREEWEDAWWANSDGGGIAYLSKGAQRVRVFRSMDRDELRKEYERVLETERVSHMVVHMRIATHGAVNLENAHPFVVRGKDADAVQVVAHNGIVAQLARETRKGESDTRAFVRLILSQLPERWETMPALEELITDYLGGDKLAVLTAGSDTPLMRLGAWQKDKSGIMWSNRYHRFHGKSAKSAPRFPRWSAASEWADIESEGNTLLHHPLEEGTLLLPLEAEEHDAYRRLPIPLARDWHTLSKDEDKRAQALIEDAVDAGYCKLCLYRPCACAAVCWECELLEDECECGDSDAPVIDAVPA